MNVLSGLSMVLVLAFGMTASAARGVDSSGGGQPAPAACDGLNGKVFTSIHPYEMGLGPNGPVYGSRRIEFAQGQVSYRLSDYGLSGHYECSGIETRITTDLQGGGEMTGAWNPEAGVLFFNGIWFREAQNR